MPKQKRTAALLAVLLAAFMAAAACAPQSASVQPSAPEPTESAAEPAPAFEVKILPL